MSFLGHVENGVVVFDEPVVFPEGTTVRVEAIVPLNKTPAEPSKNAVSLLAGSIVRDEDPFGPALPADAWEANR